MTETSIEGAINEYARTVHLVVIGHEYGDVTDRDIEQRTIALNALRAAIAAIAADKTAAVAAEREACAKIAENWSYPFPRTDAISIIGADIAKAIREQKT